MRLLSLALAAALVAGCATTSYKISHDELQRLATLPPEARGQQVRVDQELVDSDVAEANRVEASTECWCDDHRGYHGSSGYNGGGYSGGGRGGQTIGGNGLVDHRGGPGGGGPSGGSPSGGGHALFDHRGGGGGGGHGGGGSIGGGGGGKDAAVAVLVAAAAAMVVVAAVEASRFDGDVALHPMHPVHLVAADGSDMVVPLADVDPQLVASADHAIVRSTEGPWRQLSRAPLWRNGMTYSMYGGEGSLRSIDGNVAMGPAFTVQLGYFPTANLGLLGSMFFAWRDNAMSETLFDSRYTAEAQYLPLKVGDAFHAGVYGGYGLAYQFEDGFANANDASNALTGGAMFQLALHTRIALTARLGLAAAHGEQTQDLQVGLSVY